MRIQYVCHACLYVETSDAKIAIDPWFNGPAYQKQWYTFPKPVETDLLQKADFILVTHGHEDHLHSPSLELMNKKAKVFYPYQWKAGIETFVRELGFQHHQEAISYQSVQITKETKITFVSNNLDSIVVIENNGLVFMNLNDALNAHNKFIVKVLCEALLKFWPVVDYLFCGLGGAGYFPNCVHHSGKDDLEVGKLREQFLAHTFCKIPQTLKPRYILPFVPGFALLEDNKRWINGVKFSRHLLPDYYKNHFDQTSEIQFVNMYPGDWFEQEMLVKSSPYHEQEKEHDLSHLVEIQYAKEIEAYNVLQFIHADQADALFERAVANLPFASRVYPKEVFDYLSYSIKFVNLKEERYFNIDYRNGVCTTSITADLPVSSWQLVTMRSQILEYALDSEWGGDVFMVGYGADIHILDDRALLKNQDIICLRLLTKIPVATDYLLKQPFRMAKFILTNPINASLIIKQKLKSGGNPNKVEHNERSHWINKTQCEICMACNLPLLDNTFGDLLEGQEQLELLEDQVISPELNKVTLNGKHFLASTI